MSVMLGPALPLQKRRFGAQDCRNRVDSWTLRAVFLRKNEVPESGRISLVARDKLPEGCQATALPAPRSGVQVLFSGRQ